MKKHTKEEALKIILESADAYETRLNNYHFLLIYQKKNVEKGKEDTGFAWVGFRSNNFKHFTGVTTDLTSQRFYDRCLAHQLSVDDFELDRTKRVDDKLTVLPLMSELFYGKCEIGPFIRSGISIEADYFSGDTHGIISLGFRYSKSDRSPDSPVSLYNETVRRLTNPTNKVLAVFRKKYNEPKFSNCIYLSKGQSLDKLHVPSDIKDIVVLDFHEA